MPLNVVSSVGFLWGPWPGTRTCGDSVGPPRAYLRTPRRSTVWVRVRSPRARSRPTWLGRWWLRRSSGTIRPVNGLSSPERCPAALRGCRGQTAFGAAITGGGWTSARWPRPGGFPPTPLIWARFHGTTPSISVSSEKLRTVLIRTISPRTRTFVEGGCDGDRTNQVGRHEDFQPEQQCPAERRAQR